MSNKVKCTCGWSWNKSDSSKKDMYICHQCGKDNTMKDGGWLNKFDAPEAQTGIKTFYNNYINSPKYKERLTLQEYENPDKVVSDRVNHLMKTKLNIIKDTGEFTGNNIGSGYNSPTNIVDYDEMDLKLYPGVTSEDIKVHEFSHAVSALSPKNNSNLRLNKKEAAEINLRNKNKQEHERNPEEAKADMDVLRYHLKKDNLYDTGTQEFTPELYNKAKQKYKNNKTIKRFFNRFSDKDAIYLMNTIAQNSESSINDIPLAQNGIEGTMGGLTDQGFNYNGAWGGTMQMGGTLPGSVGFTYARTQGSAPANGKYTKKTKASAQNGQEMKFYQEGLDWKPKNISKDGSIIEDDRGQWAYPGEITRIPSNQITMQGVPYPVVGISDTGDTQIMYPDQEYSYEGKSVTEYPIMQKGGDVRDGYSDPDYVTGTSRRAFNKMVGMGNYLVPAETLNAAADLAKNKGLDFGIETSGPADAVRHTAAAASVSSRLPVPKFIEDYSPNLDRAIRIAGANILGLGHELTNLNKGFLMDIKNNYTGSLIGSLPGLTDAQRNKMIINQLQKGKLSVDNPKKSKKENGGWLNKYN
jgi:hypothetical protein